MVIVAFESLEDAQRWYSNSPYSDTIPIRQRSANTRLCYRGLANQNHDTYVVDFGRRELGIRTMG